MIELSISDFAISPFKGAVCLSVAERCLQVYIKIFEYSLTRKSNSEMRNAVISLNFDIERVSADDLVDLVSTEATESLTLEFKMAAYSPDNEGGREFLKDVSALANTAGGWLIIGIREEGGVASEITPIVSPDADRVQQRLESLLQSGIEPRIAGTRMKPVPFESGYLLVIRVPKSAVPPHRVIAHGSNRYHLRSSAGVYEASYNELRNMFIQSAAVSETFAAFRDSRLALIEAGNTPVPLAQEPARLVIHILPTSAIGLGRQINLKIVDSQSFTFRPIGSSGHNFGFNIDGYLTERGGQVCHGYTQVFRDGAIEATRADFDRDESKGDSVVG